MPKRCFEKPGVSAELEGLFEGGARGGEGVRERGEGGT